MNNRESLQNNPGQLVEKLVADLKKKKAVDVRFEFEDNDQWSVVTTHIEENDSEISLRLRAGENYELYFGYYDEEDEFHEVIQPLTPEERDIVPGPLQKIMYKALTDEEGLRIPGTLLSK